MEPWARAQYLVDMSFTKRLVPNLIDLVRFHEEIGTEEFIRRFSKPDALIGSPESLQYVRSILEVKITSTDNVLPSQDQIRAD